MSPTITLTGLAILLTGPAFADGSCSKSPASQFQPTSTLESRLKAAGLTVRQIKVENGCYEVYAVDGTGVKVNTAYNAETLVKVDNPEAGEN